MFILRLHYIAADHFIIQFLATGSAPAAQLWAHCTALYAAVPLVNLYGVAEVSSFHCDIRASFATAFHNWRTKNGIPLKTVARALQVSIATVSTWESGKRFPT